MADNDIIKAIKVEGLDLHSSTIGQDIKTRFDSIDQNFTKILEAEYLKGVKGDSVYSETIVLKDDNYKDMFDEIKKLIFGDNYLNIGKERLNKLGEQKVTLIYEKEEVSDYVSAVTPTLLSILPFIYKDPLFDDNVSNIIIDESNIYTGLDYSCTVCYDKDTQTFTKLDVPTVYYDEQTKRFNWKINGVDTGLAAQGPPGSQGETGTGLLIAEYAKDYETKDGETYEYYKLTSFYYNIDDDTNINNSNESSHNNVNWVPTSGPGSENINKIPLISNCLVFAREYVEPSLTPASDEAPVVEEGDETQITEDNQTIHNWRWGLLFIDKSSGSTIYKLKDGGSLNEIIGLNGESLMNLMKKNRYTFIPNKYKDDNVLNIEPKAYGHIIYSDDEHNLQLKSTTSSARLESQYSNNIFKKIQIPITGTDKYLTISSQELNGSKGLHIDFSNGGTIKGNIESADKLTVNNVGDSKYPVYFNNGIPVQCDNTLNNDISGNAATASRADAADKLTSTNVGSASQPVYFDAKGQPQVCDSIEVPADKALKLVDNNGNDLNIGAEDTPVYFEGGIPKVCTSIGLKAATAGTADEAKKLTVNAGSTNTPVYFEDGIPKACGIVSAADGAYRLITNSKTRSASGTAIGSAKQPIYFDNGIPVVCDGKLGVDTSGKADTAGTADEAKKLTVNAGTINTPVYFEGGVPKVCTSIGLKANTAGLADKASSLENARSFSFNDAIICNNQSFDGQKDVNFNVTALNSSYLNWGSIPTNSLATVRPLDIALNPALNQNRLSFMPAKDIQIFGSSDGKTYKEISMSDTDKVSLVTTGLSKTLSIGNLVKDGQGMMVSITASPGELYFSLKKIMINVSTNGATDSAVTIMTTDFNGKTADIGTYKLHGWSGWNAITLNTAFGQAGSSQKTHIKNIKLIFTAAKTDDNSQSKLAIYNIAMFGENCWVASGGDLPKWGHLYKYDIYKNVSFPARLEVGDHLTAKSIQVTGDSNIRNMTALNIDPESGNGIIGKTDNRWEAVYTKKLDASDSVKTAEVTADIVDVDVLKAKQFDISNIKHVKIQEKLPSSSSITQDDKTKTAQLTASLSRIANSWACNADPKGAGKSKTTSNICNITLNTSTLPKVQGDVIDVTLARVCVPIGITYLNDYDTHGALWWKWKAWASVYIKDITLKLYQGTKEVASINFGEYKTTCYSEYNANYRNCAVYYPSKSNVLLDNLKLGSQVNGKYKDITLTAKLSYMVYRNDGGDYSDCYNTRVGTVYTPGVYFSTNIPSAYNAKFVFGTGAPNIAGKMSLSSLNNSAKTTATYTALSTLGNYMYLTEGGICITQGNSSLFIVPPKDGSKNTKDNFGYIEVRQYDNTVSPGVTTVKKKSLFDLLS